MTTYTFALNLDGQERSEPAVDLASDSDAVREALPVLQGAVHDHAPQLAYVAVFRGSDEDGQPLGAWDWDAQTREYRWMRDN